jgi:hypothetical protein
VVLASFELTSDEHQALLELDRPGLTLAGNSFSAKRAKYKRWMHTQVKQVPVYASLIPPPLLAGIGALIRERASRQANVTACLPHVRLRQRLDFVPFQAQSLHNREHMLYELPGLQALATTWELLRSAVLLNHHMLRCYGITAGAPQKTEIHREHPRPGTFLTYVVVNEGAEALKEAHLELLNERHEVVGRFALGAGTAVVMSADILHRVDPAGASGSAGPLLLVFKSLAAIQ